MSRTFLTDLDGTQACRRDPAAFFSHGGSGSAERAKELCRSCPFQERCLQYALIYDLYGVWGGATRDERQTYQQARGIRPRSAMPPNIIPTRKRRR